MRVRTAGALLVTFALLWQVVAVAHLALSVHRLCHEHHAVVHGQGEAGDLHHHDHGSPVDSGDTCFVMVALLHAGALTDFLTPVQLPVPQLELQPRMPALEGVVLPQRYLFHVAPSTSPPGASVG